MARPRVRIVVVGQTPPPFGGQAAMIQKTLEGDYGPDIRLSLVRMQFSKEMDQMGKFRLRKLLVLPTTILRALVAHVRNRANVLYYCPSGPRTFPVLRDIFILTLTRPFFRRTIFHSHAAGTADYEARMCRLGRWLFRRAYYHPDAFVRLSELSPDEGARWGAKVNFAVPNGLDDVCPGGPPSRDPDPNRPMRILFVGVICDGKGAHVLLETSRLLAERGLPFQMQLIGCFESPGLEAEAHQFIKTYGLDRKVSFPGVLTGERKWDAYRWADVMCMPTHFVCENLPLVMLEAMMFGLPVVTTDWHANRAIVMHGETGLITPIKDPKATADALERLIRDPALRRRMGEAARARFVEHYTVDRYIKRMKHVFAVIGETL